MNLGGFSISLSVKDLEKSRQFYEALGFQTFHGDAANGWLILKGENVNIGLFQGMFEKNIMTFNPGWDTNAQNTETFTDVRDIQRAVKSKGVVPDKEVDESGEGPGSFMITDPDGNQILIDQHR